MRITRAGSLRMGSYRMSLKNSVVPGGVEGSWKEFQEMLVFLLGRRKVSYRSWMRGIMEIKFRDKRKMERRTNTNSVDAAVIKGHEENKKE
ncbi:hypothetical protein PanWU01x14_330080 [Parasponia andersonii]|uniref:Uncharacterized protein n=1 Tax=Parasponia andersonii TaxID=3476 RepID=A0A2P5AI85_PARAD|nr:hypothetical protein PanWU01x14_330080 [Parasponia andersonii]